MNIDERLEALTHTVELLASMQIETEKKMGRLADFVSDMADGIARLAQIAQDHQQRLENLEGNQTQP